MQRLGQDSVHGVIKLLVVKATISILGDCVIVVTRIFFYYINSKNIPI